MNDFSICVATVDGVVDAVDVEIPALQDAADLGGVGVAGEPQGVLLLDELVGVVAVDGVGAGPVAVLLGEAADEGVIVSGPEVISAGLRVPVLPAVAEGVAVRRRGRLLVAEGVVVVGLHGAAAAVGQVDHVAVGVEEVVGGPAAVRAGDEIHAPEVLGSQRAVAQLRNDVPAVRAVCRRPPLRRPVAGGCFLTAAFFASGAGGHAFLLRVGIQPFAALRFSLLRMIRSLFRTEIIPQFDVKWN